MNFKDKLRMCELEKIDYEFDQILNFQLSEHYIFLIALIRVNEHSMCNYICSKECTYKYRSQAYK